ncbi:hypothetical protein FBULB1_11250 [Fusarium bulbicola]|nr:hypothetical protein FBULB1_11250 [Fusarium bulbicola]
MWEDDGFMVKAIHKAGQVRVTQKTFDRLDYPFLSNKAKKGVVKGGPELQGNNSNGTGSHTQHVATDASALPLPEQDSSDELPLSSKDSMSGSHNDKLSTSPNRAISVDSDDSFPAPLTQYPECAQQKDKFNCGIFTLTVLQALLNGNSIPSQVGAKNLRCLFAAQLEGPPGSELIVTSCEAASPPRTPPISRRASFEQSHSDAQNFGLLGDPGEHGVASPPLSHLQEFAKNLEKTKLNLGEDVEALVRQRRQLAKMTQERYSVEQKLAKDQKSTDELTRLRSQKPITERRHASG